jgi:Bacterial PH domain
MAQPQDSLGWSWLIWGLLTRLDSALLILYPNYMSENSPPVASVGSKDGDNYIVMQSWRNQIGTLMAFLAVACAAIFLTEEFPKFTTMPTQIGGIEFSFPILSLIPVLVLIRGVFVVQNERFVITPEYIIHVTGRLAWRGRSSRLAYGNVQEIEIEETILQRILGVGDLKLIPMAGAESSSIKLHGVMNPRAVKDLIRAHTKRAKHIGA